MPQPKEHHVQKAIVDALRLAGLEVQETTAYRQKGSSGVDKGVPDLLVYIPGLPIIIGLEVKRNQTAKRSPEQLAMAAKGFYEFVWDAEMAIDAVITILYGKTKLGETADGNMAVNRLRRVKGGLATQQGGKQ